MHHRTFIVWTPLSGTIPDPPFRYISARSCGKISWTVFPTTSSIFLPENRQRPDCLQDRPLGHPCKKMGIGIESSSFWRKRDPCIFEQVSTGFASRFDFFFSREELHAFPSIRRAEASASYRAHPRCPPGSRPRRLSGFGSPSAEDRERADPCSEGDLVARHRVGPPLPRTARVWYGRRSPPA